MADCAVVHSAHIADKPREVAGLVLHSLGDLQNVLDRVDVGRRSDTTEADEGPRGTDSVVRARLH